MGNSLVALNIISQREKQFVASVLTCASVEAAASYVPRQLSRIEIVFRPWIKDEGVTWWRA